MDMISVGRKFWKKIFSGLACVKWRAIRGKKVVAGGRGCGSLTPYEWLPHISRKKIPAVK